MAPHVKSVYGIDVSEKILAKAVQFTSENGVKNFTPVLAESFKEEIPDGVDIVFSIVVMQHLTRDLVEDYFRSLALEAVAARCFHCSIPRGDGGWRDLGRRQNCEFMSLQSVGPVANYLTFRRNVVSFSANSY
jgi:hypothetical protein